VWNLYFITLHLFMPYYIVGTFSFTSGCRSCGLMSHESASPNQVAEEVYQHHSVDTLPKRIIHLPTVAGRQGDYYILPILEGSASIARDCKRDIYSRFLHINLHRLFYIHTYIHTFIYTYIYTLYLIHTYFCT
jgi:hypothetical protein